MASLASLYKDEYVHFEGDMSWKCKARVMHGNDPSAIQRHEFGTKVWKSSDDGAFVL